MIHLGFFNRTPKKNNEKRIQPNVIKWPDYIVDLDNKNFETFIETYPFCLVDFWAPWCAPCKALAPRLRRLSHTYKGQVAFGRLNTHDHQKIAKRFKIMGIPHIIFFCYGKPISSVTGLKSISDIKKIIEHLINKTGG